MTNPFILNPDSNQQDQGSASNPFLQHGEGQQPPQQPQDPWDADPLQSIPDPTDQVVYFGFAHIFFYFVIFCILLLGIWFVYKGVKGKASGDKVVGAMFIILAVVLNGINHYLCNISYYMTQADANALSGMQHLKLSVAESSYNIFGTAANGTPITVIVTMLALFIIPTIILICSMVSFSKKVKAERAKG